MKLTYTVEKEERRVKNALDLEKRLQREGFELIGEAQLVDGQIRFSEPATGWLYWETAPIHSKDTEIRLIEKSMLPEPKSTAYSKDGYLIYARETKELRKSREEIIRAKERHMSKPFVNYNIDKSNYPVDK